MLNTLFPSPPHPPGLPAFTRTNPTGSYHSSQLLFHLFQTPNVVKDGGFILQVQAGEAHAQASEQTIEELLDQSKQIIDHDFQSEQQA